MPSVGLTTKGRLPARLLLQIGGCYPPLVRQGQIARLYTCMFLHSGVEHLAMNMLALWQIGHILAPVLPAGKLLVCYLGGGVGGSLLSSGWRFGAKVGPEMHLGVTLVRHLWATMRKVVISVGASGAICGLIGTAFAIRASAGTLRRRCAACNS